MEGKLDPKNPAHVKKAADAVRERWGLPDEARVEFHPVEKGERCKHQFEMKTGQWAACKHCHWGIQMGESDEIRNGHLYSHGQRII